MPRNEQRPVIFGTHARKRAAERFFDLNNAEAIVRTGAIRPDAKCDFIAFGAFGGQRIECACLDKGDHIFVKTVYPG